MRPVVWFVGSVLALGLLTEGTRADQAAVTLVERENIAGLEGDVFQAEIVRFHRYTPALITVAPGTTVVWTNYDIAEHNVRVRTGEANTLSEDIATELVFPEESAAMTFHEAGTYRYFCEPHPYMQGTVVVEQGGK